MGGDIGRDLSWKKDIAGSQHADAQGQHADTHFWVDCAFSDLTRVVVRRNPNEDLVKGLG